MGSAALRELLLSSADCETVRRDRRHAAILERLSLCHTEAFGGRILCCPSCGAQLVLYNPCNQRGCPECAEHVQHAWQRRMDEHLLPAAHYHIVFSAPGSLTDCWRRDPRAVIDALFAAARRTFTTEAKRRGFRLGITMVFHSHGAGMCYKPHLHCLLTAGGIDRQGQWHTQQRLCEKTLRRDFARWMRKEAVARFAAREAEPLHREPADTWRVYAVLHRRSPRALIGYLARSMHGVVIDNREQLTVCGDSVSFTTHHHGERRCTTVSREEFLTRYFAHIPPRGAVTVRHYGLYAPRCREALEQARAQLPQAAETEPAEEQAESEEHCPVCHSPLRLGIRFTGEELPPVLQLVRRNRGSPLPHGELIHAHGVSA